MAKHTEQTKEQPKAPTPAAEPAVPQRKISEVALELARRRLTWLVKYDRQALLHFAHKPKGDQDLATELARIGEQAELAGRRHRGEGLRPEQAERKVMDEVIAPVEADAMTLSPDQDKEAEAFHLRFIAGVGKRFAEVPE